jgi:SAM-dependent methyltransferase
METTSIFPAVPLPPLKNSNIAPIKALYDTHYAERFPGQRKGLYRAHDWQRIEHALSLIPHGTHSVLDVGTGPGALLNHLTVGGQIPVVTGIDLKEYSTFYRVAKFLDWRRMNVCNLSFAKDEYDVVICMEVLEHLQPSDFEKAVAELRRVARRRLITTVPFKEPLPLPSYHKQRFDELKILKTFPQAQISLLRRSKDSEWSWALIVEDY